MKDNMDICLKQSFIELFDYLGPIKRRKLYRCGVITHEPVKLSRVKLIDLIIDDQGSYDTVFRHGDKLAIITDDLLQNNLEIIDELLLVYGNSTMHHDLLGTSIVETVKNNVNAYLQIPYEKFGVTLFRRVLNKVRCIVVDLNITQPFDFEANQAQFFRLQRHLTDELFECEQCEHVRVLFNHSITPPVAVKAAEPAKALSASIKKNCRRQSHTVEIF